MKKSAMIVLALLAVGCKTTPEQIKTTATAVGYAAGMVANETGIKAEARNAVVDILGEVRRCTPDEGQSFESAWTPVIKAKVSELVAAGKIDAPTGELVTAAAVMAAKGIDYLFDVRYPKARKYTDLVSAGVSGAIDGFLTAFKPVDARNVGKVECDKEAYEWLKAHK